MVMQTNTPLVLTGERFHPDMSGNIALEHMHRYIYALPYAEGRTVLDIASGEGYGAALLASRATFVFGVDIAEDAIAHATRKYRFDNLEFRQGSCLQIPLTDDAVDLVISFETIEHHDKHEQMLSEIKRVLKPNGIALVSSPNKAIYTDKPANYNRFHVKELYREEFETLFRHHFRNVVFLGQKVIFGSAIVPDAGATTVASVCTDLAGTLSSPRLNEPMYNLVLASDGPVSAATVSFFEADNSFSAKLSTVYGNVRRALLRRILRLTKALRT